MEFLSDIPKNQSFRKIEHIDKGWSNDQKYYIETVDNQKLLLKISDISAFEKKKEEFDNMSKVYSLGVNTNMPIGIGSCENNKKCYTLMTWLEGRDATEDIPELDSSLQYSLGYEAGEILRKIHCIPAPKPSVDWKERFSKKVKNKIDKYKACGIKYKKDTLLINYIQNHTDLLSNRPVCFQHGDYHVSNLTIGFDNKVGVIDFNRFDYGDPWEEFNRLPWCVEASKNFAKGRIDGYFNSNPPSLFWKLLAYYVFSNTLSSLYWAIPFGNNEVEVMVQQYKNILQWYDNFNGAMVPLWYKA